MICPAISASGHRCHSSRAGSRDAGEASRRLRHRPRDWGPRHRAPVRGPSRREVPVGAVGLGPSCVTTASSGKAFSKLVPVSRSSVARSAGMSSLAQSPGVARLVPRGLHGAGIGRDRPSSSRLSRSRTDCARVRFRRKPATRLSRVKKLDRLQELRRHHQRLALAHHQFLAKAIDLPLPRNATHAPMARLVSAWILHILNFRTLKASRNFVWLRQLATYRHAKKAWPLCLAGLDLP